MLADGMRLQLGRCAPLQALLTCASLAAALHMQSVNLHFRAQEWGMDNQKMVSTCGAMHCLTNIIRD